MKMDEDPIDVEALYARYAPMVLRRCRRLLRDEDEALDAMQEVFVRVLNRGRALDMQYPSSLLYRIATNLCLNRIRTRRRRPAMEGDEVLHRIAAVSDSEPRLVLERLFGRHPESTRTMAVLHHVDGMTLAEVAQVCGMSVSGVRKRLRALRASLVAMEGA